MSNGDPNPFMSELLEAKRVAEIIEIEYYSARAEIKRLRARVAELERGLEVFFSDESGDLDYMKWYVEKNVLKPETYKAIVALRRADGDKGDQT